MAENETNAELDELDRKITDALGDLDPDGLTQENVFYLDEAYERGNVELMRTFLNNVTPEYDLGFVWTVFEKLREAGHMNTSELVNPESMARRKRLLKMSAKLGYDPQSKEFEELWIMAMANPANAAAIERIVAERHTVDTTRINLILSGSKDPVPFTQRLLDRAKMRFKK